MPKPGIEPGCTGDSNANQTVQEQNSSEVHLYSCATTGAKALVVKLLNTYLKYKRLHFIQQLIQKANNFFLPNTHCRSLLLTEAWVVLNSGKTLALHKGTNYSVFDLCGQGTSSDTEAKDQTLAASMEGQCA